MAVSVPENETVKNPCSPGVSRGWGIREISSLGGKLLHNVPRARALPSPEDQARGIQLVSRDRGGARLFFCCGCAARFFFAVLAIAWSCASAAGWASGIQLAMVSVLLWVRPCPGLGRSLNPMGRGPASRGGACIFFFLLRVTHLLPGWASNPIGHGLRRGLCGAGGARLFFGCLARFFFAVGAPLPGAGPVRRNPMGRGPASRGARLFFCCGCAARFFFCCGCAAGSLTHLLPGWASGIQLAMVAVGACAGPGGGRVYFFAAGARRGFFFAVGARPRLAHSLAAGVGLGNPIGHGLRIGACAGPGGGGGCGCRVYFFAAGARQLWGGAFIFLLRVRVAFIFLLRVRELTHSLTRCPESTNSKKAHTTKKKNTGSDLPYNPP